MSANKKEASAVKKERAKGRYDLRKLVVLAMLVAMTVVLERFLSIKTAGWKIGFAFVPPVVAAILYGPIESGIVYALADFIGAILFPFGTYHPGFTIVAFLMGFVFGIFLNKRPFAFLKSGFEWKKIRLFPNIILPVIINSIALGLLVNTIWVSQLYGSKTYGGWFMYRLPEYAILVPVELLLIPVLIKLCDLLIKSGAVKLPKSSEERLNAISRKESILGLERVTELMRLLDDPQNEVPVVHVSGTNGKGSFTAMLESVLRSAGYKVGTFTSPAITGVTDSFRINGAPVSDEELDERLSEITPFVKEMAEKPTEFEVMTAAAYELFAQENCDIAIVECGLGGAGDSTNVIKKPLLSVITNVELDHTDRLGRTTAEIAKHKAGIIKQGRPVLYGGADESAYEVIARTAEEKNAKLTCTDMSRLTVLSCGLNGTEIEFKGFGNLHLSLLGEYQPKNAANVLTAIELLRENGVEISDEAVREGLSSASWHARFELLRREPIVIFDGSHNPDGIRYAAQSIKSCLPGGRAVLLMAVMADKDYWTYPSLLKDAAVKVFTVNTESARSLPAVELEKVFTRSGVPAQAFETLSEGVRAAYGYAKENGLPLVALGTLYMYKAFTDALDAIED